MWRVSDAGGGGFSELDGTEGPDLKAWGSFSGGYGSFRSCSFCCEELGSRVLYAGGGTDSRCLL